MKKILILPLFTLALSANDYKQNMIKCYDSFDTKHEALQRAGDKKALRKFEKMVRDYCGDPNQKPLKQK